MQFPPRFFQTLIGNEIKYYVEKKETMVSYEPRHVLTPAQGKNSSGKSKVC
jgi:hypothetical protein